MKIGIDIDGVIADFVKTFSLVVRNRYRVSLTEEEIFCHDLFQVLGVPKEEAIEIIRETLIKDLMLIPGACSGMKQLKRRHEIYLLSARSKDLAATTQEWLKRKKIPYDKILFLEEGNKHQINIKLDVLIEDNLEDAIGWLGKAKSVVLFDHPWNRTLDVKKSFRRVKNWPEIVKLVESESKRS